MHAVIAIDVDETLAEFSLGFLGWAAANGHPNSGLPGMVGYRYTDTLGATQAEVDLLLSAFRADGGLLRLEPAPASQAAVAALASADRLVVVTGRRHTEAEHTERWVELHFPGVFADVVTGDHYGLERIPKSVLCRRVGAHTLVDDLPTYVNEVTAAGVGAVLLHRELPWQKDRLHPGVQVARSWGGVVDVICERRTDGC